MEDLCTDSPILHVSKIQDQGRKSSNKEDFHLAPPMAEHNSKETIASSIGPTPPQLPPLSQQQIYRLRATRSLHAPSFASVLTPKTSAAAMGVNHQQECPFKHRKIHTHSNMSLKQDPLVCQANLGTGERTWSGT